MQALERAVANERTLRKKVQKNQKKFLTKTKGYDNISERRKRAQNSFGTRPTGCEKEIEKN